MTRDRFYEIFETTSSKWEGDNCLKGAVIISKYTGNVFHGADHDIIYSENMDVLIEAGITEDDALELAKLNWMIEDGEYLACFV